MMTGEPGAEVANEAKSTFDYPAFRAILIAELNPPPISLFGERVKNKALELTGIRPSEARPTLHNRKIEFVGECGKKWAPPTELTEGIEVRLVDGQDDEAGVSITLKDLKLPRSWFDGKHPHSGFKILHELGHLAQANRDPNRQYVRDDLRIQQLMAEALVIVSGRALGAIVVDIEKLITTGNYSNLGIADDNARSNHLAEKLHKLEHLYERSPETFTRVYKETSIDLYMMTVADERAAWAEGLKMLRQARSVGVSIDNRRTDQIFYDIDRYLASRVNPEWTIAIKNLRSRRRLGLPDKGEDLPTLDSFNLEANTAGLKTLETIATEASESVRDYLHTSDEENLEHRKQTLTPIQRIDSRIMVSEFGPFSDNTKPILDRDTETQIRLCCLAWAKGEAKYVNYDEPDPELTVVGNIGISNVSGVPGRHSLRFLTINASDPGPKRRLESQYLVFDEHADNLDKKTAPRDLEGESYYFSRRITPEVDGGYVGMQLVGRVGEIWHNAQATGKTIEAYLKDIGYDTAQVGNVWRAYTNTFAGWVNE